MKLESFDRNSPSFIRMHSLLSKDFSIYFSKKNVMHWFLVTECKIQKHNFYNIIRVEKKFIKNSKKFIEINSEIYSYLNPTLLRSEYLLNFVESLIDSLEHLDFDIFLRMSSNIKIDNIHTLLSEINRLNNLIFLEIR
jgi:hypothetical protein